jgi:hypothetical protein
MPETTPNRAVLALASRVPRPAELHKNAVNAILNSTLWTPGRIRRSHPYNTKAPATVPGPTGSGVQDQ